MKCPEEVLNGDKNQPAKDFKIMTVNIFKQTVKKTTWMEWKLKSFFTELEVIEKNQKGTKNIILKKILM